MTTLRLACAVAAAAALAAPALAGKKIDSAYSDLTYEAEAGAKATCKGIEADEESGSVLFECKGYGGIKVYVAEGDLRAYVGYGMNGRGEIAGLGCDVRSGHACRGPLTGVQIGEE